MADGRRGAVALLAAAALAGCGSAAAKPTAAAPKRATPVASATPKPVKITITTPRAHATVKAGAAIRVAGKATPDATVLLSGGCFKQGCQSLARAGSDGRWTATLRLYGAHARIEASTPESDVLDAVPIHVRAPARVPAPSGPPAVPTSTPRPVPKRVVVVGDSLAVGTKDLLPPRLPGMQVRTDALTGRPLAAGMQIIDGLDLRSQPTVLAVSLFTNDDPRNVSGLEAAVRRSLADVGPAGCAVWATIVRPPFGGVSYQAANARLNALEGALGGRLVVVPWAEAVAQDPSLVGPDHVHGTPAGYQARADLYAQAIQTCGG